MPYYNINPQRNLINQNGYTYYIIKNPTTEQIKLYADHQQLQIKHILILTLEPNGTITPAEGIPEQLLLYTDKKGKLIIK